MEELVISTVSVQNQSSSEHSNRLKRLGYPIGVFGAIGAGIGLTGGVLLNQSGGGSGLFSGLLVLVVIGVALLLGPVVAAILGTQIADRNAQTAYVDSFVGTAAGYFVMMLVVILVLMVSLGIGMDGGAAGSGAGTSASTSSSSGPGGGGLLDKWLVPVLALAIPTGLTGLVSAGLRLKTSAEGAVEGPSTFDLPVKKIAAGVGVVVLLIVGATVVPGLFSQDPQVEVEGGAYGSGDTLHAEATLTNPTSSEVSNTITANLVIDGEVVTSGSTEYTVAADSETVITFPVVRTSEVSQEQIRTIQNGNFELQFIINDQIVATH